jgi:hypothetical protein
MSDYDLINGEIINVTITVDEETVTGIINTAARGPAGADGGGTNSITSATTSDGTANLSLSNVTTATATITGMSVAPTAATTTSTTQLATTAFVQQELASGVAVAKNLEFLAHNGTGVTITKGSIVYINGAVSGNPRITLGQANNNTNSARTIGFAKADIANGANGFVISEGELENVRTADADGIIGAGNQIYLSPTTPGAFTRTEPSAPNHLVYVGVITRASTGVNLDGRILVGIQNGYELNEIHDVAISSPAAKQVIKRNAGNTLWINEAIVSADVSDATSAATANTLVLRDGSGSAVFFELYSSAAFIGDLNVSGGIQADGPIIAEAAVTFQGTSSVTFDSTTYTYGTGAASAHRIALGAGTTGAALFGAADAAAANTALNISETAGVGPVTASTQNVDTNVGSSIPVAAGTYLIEINTTFSNASSSSGNFRLSFGSNPFTVNPQRIGPVIVNETASTAFYGDNTGVGFVGGTNAATTKSSVWASGILTFSGSNSIQLRVRNTAATGTVTCDAYRMTVRKLT